MPNTTLTPEQIAAFERDGYVIVRNFINTEQVTKLHRVALEDDAMTKHSYTMGDAAGMQTKLALWFTCGNDAYGLFARSEKVVNGVNQLLDGDAPICHYHSKLMQKEPRVGGAWEWHQDYGYWYKNEFTYPDQMISVMTAITKATKENGCLQVIKGSHKMGRVEHGFAGEQVGANMRFVNLALKTLELVYVELEPGDTLFFHSNLLHRSEANLSENSRWSLISAYNRQTNKAYNELSTSHITPIEVVPNEALMEWESTGLSEGTDFLSKETDGSVLT
jgi:phytanoyl-CoA hydroxylase